MYLSGLGTILTLALTITHLPATEAKFFEPITCYKDGPYLQELPLSSPTSNHRTADDAIVHFCGHGAIYDRKNLKGHKACYQFGYPLLGDHLILELRKNGYDKKHPLDRDVCLNRIRQIAKKCWHGGVGNEIVGVHRFRIDANRGPCANLGSSGVDQGWGIPMNFGKDPKPFHDSGSHETHESDETHGSDETHD